MVWDLTGGARRRRRRRILRGVLLVVMALGLLVAGAALWLRRALPGIAADEIGRLLNAHVETGALTLHLDGSVRVAGLVIRPKLDVARGTVARLVPHGSSGVEPLRDLLRPTADVPRDEPRNRNRSTILDDAILRADTISARFSRRSLLSLSPHLTALSIEDFLLDLQLDLDTGRWNVGTLRFNAPGGREGGLPAIRLLRGKLRYCKVLGGQLDVVTSVPIEGWFGRAGEDAPDGGSPTQKDALGGPYHFEVRTSQLSHGHGESRLSGHWQPSSIVAGAGYAVPLPAELTVTGGLSSTDIPSLERAWAIDVLAGVLKYDREGRYALDLSLKGVHGKHTPEVDALRFLIPAAAGESSPLRNVQKFLDKYQPTGTVKSIAIQANGNLKKLSDSEVEGQVVCEDISVCDRDFPYRIDHLAGELEFTPSSLRLNKLAGRHGEVKVDIEGWTKGFGADRQYRYQITSGNMVLDQALYAALNPDQKRLWDDFSPSGTVSAVYRLTRASPTDKRLSLSVDLNDVAATFRGFPYPLADLTGTVLFDFNSITLSEVVARAGGGHIRLSGRVTEPTGGRPNYYLSIDARDVPLDGTLRDALPARHRELYRCFDLRGLADIRARVFSTADANEAGGSPAVAAADPNTTGPAEAPSSGRVNFLAEVSCRQGSLKLPLSYLSPVAPAAAERGPQPAPPAVSEVTAEATITPNSVSIRKLEGRHGANPVTIAGDMLFDEGDRLKLCRMKIGARQMPLNEATLALLPPARARQAAAFHAEGDVDLVVDLEKTDANQPPAYTVTVNCLGDKINHERFPCPLQDVRGTIALAQDRIAVQDLTAVPTEAGPQVQGSSARPAIVRIDGAATLGPAAPAQAPGAWQGSFTLRATNLAFTEGLGRALPETLAAAYREVSPAGPFDLGPTTLKLTRAADETLVEIAGWAHPESCRLRVSGAPLELSGAVEVQGAYGTRGGLRGGRIRLDAGRLVLRGKAVTQTDLEATYDPNTRRWTAANFTGGCYGGRLLGSLEVGRPDRAAEADSAAGNHAAAAPGLEYRLQAALQGVDLQAFLQAGAKSDDGGSEADRKELLSSVLGSASSTSSGTMDALLSLWAPLGGARTGAARPAASGDGGAPRRRGLCRIEVANMQVGKVSPLGSVLSVLRLSEPADYTFERMRIDSYLRGEELLISTFDVSGRNAAFAGAGTMDLSTEEINLTLTGRGQRVAAAEPSVLQSLTEGLGGAVVRIEVTGPAGNPRVQTKTLPVLEDSLRLLGTPPEGKKAGQ